MLQILILLGGCKYKIYNKTTVNFIFPRAPTQYIQNSQHDTVIVHWVQG